MSAEMSTEELRDFYLRYVEVANNRDFDRMDEYAHDELIMNGTPVARDDVVAALRHHTEAVPDLVWDLQELLVDGDRIAARLIDTGTPVAEWQGLAPTGAKVSIAEIGFYRIEDGRFKAMWYSLDIDDLRRQLGG